MDTPSLTDKQAASALNARLSALSPSDISFAQSMLAYFARNGFFTERQRPHALRLAGLTPPKVAGKLADVSGILTLLNRAKGYGLKRPAFVVRAGDTVLRLSLAPDSGSNPGSVYIKRDGIYAGKISPLGTLTYDRDVYADIRDKLTPAIERMARDPVAAAGEYGHLTGKCCFCSKVLDDARSVAVGYGPKCAEKYGLAWGVRA